MARRPAFPFSIFACRKARYKSIANMAYSMKWAVFLIIKSFQKNRETTPVGYEDKKKITKAQPIGGSQ